MNNLSKKQNSPEELRLLITQHFTYKSAKTLLLLEFLLSVILPIVISILLLFFTDKTLVGVFGSISALSLAFSLLLSRLIERIKEEAALIQQQFDCSLFGIPSGVEIDNEMICARLAKYKDKDFPRKNDWYNVDRTLPRERAILACQKENVSWTSRTSRWFVGAVIVLAVFAISAVIVVLSVNGWRLSDLLSSLITFSPLISFCLSSLLSVVSESKTTRKLEKMVERLSGVSESASLNESDLSKLQTEIFLYRKTKFLVPEFFDKLCYRKNKEIQDQVLRGSESKKK